VLPSTLLVRSGATVAFENIDFCYPDGRRVFSNFSLRIEAGQRVGLVGQSGCGKSTLFVLLQRFYDVQGGSILLMGWSGRAPAPPASEAGKGRQRRGARYVRQTQFCNRRN
jgi:ABC-type multidrug transport system fused ATPase/permease subunit